MNLENKQNAKLSNTTKVKVTDLFLVDVEKYKSEKRIISKIKDVKEIIDNKSSEDVDSYLINQSKELLRNCENVYSIRLNRKYRLIFSYGNKCGLNEDEYLFISLTPHNYSCERYTEEIDKKDFFELDESVLLVEKPELDEAQQLAKKNKNSIDEATGYRVNAKLCLGCAGSGKTLIANYKYIDTVNSRKQNGGNLSNSDVIYLTYSLELKEAAIKDIKDYCGNSFDINIYTVEGYIEDICDEVLNCFFENFLQQYNREFLNVCSILLSEYKTQYKLIKPKFKAFESYLDDYPLIKNNLNCYKHKGYDSLKEFKDFYQNINRQKIKHDNDVEYLYVLYKATHKYIDDDGFANKINKLEGNIQKSKYKFDYKELNQLRTIFKNYKQYCFDNHLFDANMASLIVSEALQMGRSKISSKNKLIYEIYKKVIEQYKSANIIVDEVQDLTFDMLKAILLLYKRDGGQENNVFLCGDTNQSINPSTIGRSDIETCVKECPNLILEKNDFSNFNKTYRLNEDLCNFVNSVNSKREKNIGNQSEEERYEIHAHDGKGNDFYAGFCYMGDKILSKIYSEALDRQDTVCVITENSASKKQFLNDNKQFDNASDMVKTVSEVKGLEFDTVLIYNMLSNNNDVFAPKDEKDYSFRKRMVWNRLFVSITRPKRSFIFIESPNVVDSKCAEYIFSDYIRSVTDDNYRSFFEADEITDINLLFKRAADYIMIRNYEGALNIYNTYKERMGNNEKLLYETCEILQSNIFDKVDSQFGKLIGINQLNIANHMAEEFNISYLKTLGAIYTGRSLGNITDDNVVELINSYKLTDEDINKIEEETRFFSKKINAIKNKIGGNWNGC